MNNEWHVSEDKGSILRAASHIEWKYFNFSSEEMSGIFVYFLANPANVGEFGGSRVIGRIYMPEGAFGGVAKFPIGEVKLGDHDADAQIGGENSIKVEGKEYFLKGSVDGVAWDLHYSPLAEPLGDYTDVKLDFAGFEKASWRVQMPKASVKGTLVYNGKTISIDSFGYADANWGNFLALAIEFNWAQCNSPDVSVVMGDIDQFELAGKKFGRWTKTIVIIDGKEIVFSENALNVTYDDWRMLPGINMKAPFARTIVAENDQYRLELGAVALLSDPLQLKMPLELPARPVTVEQPTMFTGGLYDKANGVLIRQIQGRGFAEYTARSLGFPDTQSKSDVVV